MDDLFVNGVSADTGRLLEGVDDATGRRIAVNADTRKADIARRASSERRRQQRSLNHSVPWPESTPTIYPSLVGAWSTRNADMTFDVSNPLYIT
jgi:hypothetical protein